MPVAKRKTVWIRCLAMLVGLTSAVGCTGNAASEKGAPVSGRVTIGGEPRAGVVVAFHPERGGPGGGLIETGPGGRFAIGTPGEPGGLPPGRYKVTLSCRVGRDGKPIDDDKIPVRGVRQIVPDAYTVLETTPAAVTVSAAGGDINLDIPAR